MTLLTLPRAGHAVAALLLAAGTAGVAPSALACSSCGCSVSTDFIGATGGHPGAGLRLDLRYDFVDQNQLRLGSHAVSRTPDALPTEHEWQQGTLTRFYTVGLDWAINHDWAINAQLPYLVREHQTIGEEQATPAVSTSETRSLGDLRLIGRWLGLSEDRSWSLQAGLKLPTGPHIRSFRSGPLGDDGETIDRGLQPGSGTVDAIIGVSHAKPFARDWDHFEQLQVRQALNKVDGFRPSTQFTASAGLRYVGFAAVVPQLQLNARVEGRETGAVADYANSGFQAVYVSPGLSAPITHRFSAYGFVQLPVYQHYTGYQLAPHYLVSAGLSVGF